MSTHDARVMLGVAAAALGLGLILSVSGCVGDMYDQNRLKPLRASSHFADGRSSRDPVPGTVARGQLRLDHHLYTGKVAGQPAALFPFPVDRAVLEYFRSRVPRARRDSEEALEFVVRSATTRELQERCTAALIRKCEILWSLLDAVYAAYAAPGWRLAESG